MKDGLGSDQWYKWQLSIGMTPDQLEPILLHVYDVLECEACEPSVCDRLRGASPSLKVVLVTARSDKAWDVTIRQIRHILGCEFRFELIMCNGGDKGIAIAGYIANNHNRSQTNYIFVDDSVEHLESRHLPSCVHRYHYVGELQRVLEFNANNKDAYLKRLIQLIQSRPVL
jgi:hypothetical protein